MLIVLRENSARHQRDTERTQKELVAEKLRKKVPNRPQNVLSSRLLEVHAYMGNV